ncbi:MAG: ACP S-malonyltransferase [Candidatus Aureabacteria bacterium]|nr:ACP S-malonyltransferase [Candidatus Auribacterota bacterium]
MYDSHKIVLLFPGQGSQEVGMGGAIAERFTDARKVFEEANEILGFDIRKLCVEGPEAELTLTKNSQPAIFVTGIACIRALQEVAVDMPLPIAAAGLSLGEFSAHVAAGSFSFADGLRLVRQRGEAMQEACDREPSTMASIVGLDLDTVKQICSLFQDRGVLDVANLNCPGQIAISGSVEAVKAAMTEAEKRGAQKAMQLQVSGAFHSRLMKPAEERLRRAVMETKIVEPKYPVIANVSALPVTQPGEIRAALLRQLCSPVLWEKSVRYLISRGVAFFMEVGHGRVLRGLMRRIDKSLKVVNVQDPDTLGKALDELKGRAGDAP